MVVSVDDGAEVATERQGGAMRMGRSDGARDESAALGEAGHGDGTHGTTRRSQ